jgi:3-dehydroquinate dehydratase/shikimate dehydrogenase
MKAMLATGAEVVKMAAAVTGLSDCVPLLELRSQLGSRGAVIVGMGEAGLATRVLAGRFGSKWTYAGSERDVGQISAASLIHDYRFRSLSDSTEIYGLVGKPIAHSFSPAMHNAAFAAAGRDAVYLPFQAATAADFVAFARAIGIKGASITIPYKVDMIDAVDEVSAVGRRIGAINTVYVKDGRWFGENTDAAAFLEPLVSRMPLAGARVAIAGAGGAARAVAVALGSSGARVRVHARHVDRARQVAELASGDVGPWPPPPGSWDLLVNCTPLGMYPHVDETPIPAAELTGRYVYDLVYNPATTRLMREAGLAGCQTIGGLEMLVGQAQEQFHYWTGRRPPDGVMREAALKRLSEFVRDGHYVD